jgi:uncharacterized membrane protein
MSLYNQIAGKRVSRIEAISDGVFAVAFTLLVLDIKVPATDHIHSEVELINAFGLLLPKLLSYFLSFMTLGIFWSGQAAQYTYIERSDRHLNWFSLFFLLFVTLVPFTTAFLSEYITYRFAVAVYWVNIFMLGVTLYANWHYASAKGYLSVAPHEQKMIEKAIRRRIVVAQTLYAFGALLSLINTYLSIGFIMVVQLNYALALFSKPEGKKNKTGK